MNRLRKIVEAFAYSAGSGAARLLVASAFLWVFHATGYDFATSNGEAFTYGFWGAVIGCWLTNDGGKR